MQPECEKSVNFKVPSASMCGLNTNTNAENHRVENLSRACSLSLRCLTRCNALLVNLGCWIVYVSNRFSVLKKAKHAPSLEEIQSQSSLVLVTVYGDGVWWRYENGMGGMEGGYAVTVCHPPRWQLVIKSQLGRTSEWALKPTYIRWTIIVPTSSAGAMALMRCPTGWHIRLCAGSK